MWGGIVHVLCPGLVLIVYQYSCFRGKDKSNPKEDKIRSSKTLCLLRRELEKFLSWSASGDNVVRSDMLVEKDELPIDSAAVPASMDTSSHNAISGTASVSTYLHVILFLQSSQIFPGALRPEASRSSAHVQPAISSHPAKRALPLVLKPPLT